jgi:hypothetical protein
MTITKTAGKLLDKLFFSSDGPWDVTHDQVLSHMEKKHGLTPQVITIPESIQLPSSALPDCTGKRREKVQKVLGRIQSAAKSEDKKAKWGSILDQVKQKKSGDIVWMEEAHMKNNPDILAHELGHLVTHNKPGLGKVLGIGRSPGGLLAGLMTANIGGMVNSPKLMYAGLGASIAQQALTLADEHKATSLAHEALADLGNAEKSKGLRRAFWGSYVPTAVGLPAAFAASALAHRRIGRRM